MMSSLDTEVTTPGSKPTAAQPSPRLQIVFKDINYSVTVKSRGKGSCTKAILTDCSGVLEYSRVTAVMGASGAGKTSLLNVLAGFTKAQEAVSGTISVSGQQLVGHQMRRISGFVHQEDVILQTMTVREALLFAAMLRLPSAMPASVKASRALAVAQQLSLTHALDSVVGSAMIKGISGGEKRRLSLGMEMVTEPSILFLDEPSSGLDAFNAYKVVHILRGMAHTQGRTIVCTIHQPSSEVFHMFDDLLVMAAGQIIYLGEAEAMVEYFAGLGYRCPTYTNPADYLFMDILNSGQLARDSTDEEAAEAGPGAAAHLPLPHPPHTRKPHGKGGQHEDLDSPPAADGGGGGSGSTHVRASGGGMAAGGVPDGVGGGGGGELHTAVEAAAAAAQRAEQERIATLIAAWRSSPQTAKLQRSFTNREFLATGISQDAMNKPASFLLQLSLLGARASRNAWRNPLVIKGKLAQTIFLSLVSVPLHTLFPVTLSLVGLRRALVVCSCLFTGVRVDRCVPVCLSLVAQQVTRLPASWRAVN